MYLLIGFLATYLLQVSFIICTWCFQERIRRSSSPSFWCGREGWCDFFWGGWWGNVGHSLIFFLQACWSRPWCSSSAFWWPSSLSSSQFCTGNIWSSFRCCWACGERRCGTCSRNTCGVIYIIFYWKRILIFCVLSALRTYLVTFFLCFQALLADDPPVRVASTYCRQILFH